MRIANIIEEARWGGPQKRIALVADALKDYGVETVVLLPALNSEKFCAILDDFSVTWKKVPLHRLGRGWNTLVIYGVTFLLDVFRLWKELRHGHYDLLHVSGGAWQFKGPIAAKLAGVPVVWHLNDTQMPKLMVVLFKCLGKLADGFFVAAKRVQEYYINGTALEKTPTYLVPAPVVTSEYSCLITNSDESINEKMYPRIVTVANVSPVKGLHTLIEASAVLKDRLEDFSVSIVGTLYSNQKPYYAILKDLIAKHTLDKNVFFMGEREHVQDVLKSADIYACSSNAEASPMAVWEAMSMGCAIVSTDVGDVAEYIKNGENGFVVPVGDAEALAEAILILSENEVMRRKFGKKARDVCCKELDVSVVAEKTASGYAAVLAANR